MVEILADYNMSNSLVESLSDLSKLPYGKERQCKLMINLCYRWGKELDSDYWLRPAIRNEEPLAVQWLTTLQACLTIQRF